MFTLENRKSYNKRKSLVKRINELEQEVKIVRGWATSYVEELTELRQGLYPEYEVQLKNKKEEITNLQRRIKNLNEVIKSEGIVVPTKVDVTHVEVVKQGKIINERNETIKKLRAEIEQLKLESVPPFNHL